MYDADICMYDSDICVYDSDICMYDSDICMYDSVICRAITNPDSNKDLINRIITKNTFAVSRIFEHIRVS